MCPEVLGMPGVVFRRALLSGEEVIGSRNDSRQVLIQVYLYLWYIILLNAS